MSELRRLCQLEEENARLKKIVAQQALDLDALNFPSPESRLLGMWVFCAPTGLIPTFR
jgi:hypothetical protein